MGFTSFVARIEPDQQAYVSGQVITGCLYATADYPTRCRYYYPEAVCDEWKRKGVVSLGAWAPNCSVIVSCKGEAKVHWREKVKEEFKNYDSSQDYFNLSTTHWQGDVIDAGTYQWPFRFVLPAGFPSSFEGSKGWIRYYLKAKADIPSGIDDESKIYFSYSNQDDLNLNSRAKKPLVIQKTDTSCFFPCKEGPVTLNFKCKRSGAVIGENFKLRGEISNDGRTLALGSTVFLEQQVVFRAGGRIKRVTREITRVKRGGTIKPGESDFYDDVNLFIPAVAPSMKNCRIMDLSYTLRFKADTGSCGSISKTVNFIIGTVPFKVEGASIAIPSGPPSTFPSPAPPPYAPPQNKHLAANYPSAPPTDSEYAPSPKDGGYVPPPKDGGYVPPPKDGGYVPPLKDGGYVPPPIDGGYSPPPPPMMPPVAPAVANPYPITGPPIAEECYNCSKGGKRLDMQAPTPTYLSYRTVMTYN